MGADVQICWDKIARYFDVEPRIIPLQVGKYVITAQDVEELIDENTIGVAAILGTTFTGGYDFVMKGLLRTDKFFLLGTRRMEPVVSVSLKDNSRYSVFDISKELRALGWIVPAYTCPADAQNVEALRIVVKENMSLTLAHNFLDAVRSVLADLEGGGSVFSKIRQGKNIPH